MEKLERECESLKILWGKLETEWERPSDNEDCYRIYPLLTTTAAIARKYIHWDKNLDFEVDVVVPSVNTGVDTSVYYYSDEKSFFNGEPQKKLLSNVSSSFLHQKEYVYMDNRKSDGKMSKDVNIYLYVKTDLLCKRCSIINNGEYKENKANYRKTTCFITPCDCTCGYYIKVRSYIDAVQKVIKKVTKVTHFKGCGDY